MHARIASPANIIPIAEFARDLFVTQSLSSILGREQILGVTIPMLHTVLLNLPEPRPETATTRAELLYACTTCSTSSCNYAILFDTISHHILAPLRCFSDPYRYERITISLSLSLYLSLSISLSLSIYIYMDLTYRRYL